MLGTRTKERKDKLKKQNRVRTIAVSFRKVNDIIKSAPAIMHTRDVLGRLQDSGLRNQGNSSVNPHSTN